MNKAYKGPEVRGAYSFDPAENSNRSTIDDFGPSMTQQSQSDEADINTIVRRFGLTGQLPENLRMPTYGDFEDVFDFHTAQNVIAQARDQFMTIPAEIRAKFENDPQRFMEFVHEEKNLDTLREWGLAKPKAPEPPKAAAAGVPAAGDPGASPKNA